MASGCRVFAELDAKEAYLQVPISLETSRLMVLNAKKGLFTPATLQFGVKTAPGIFQRIMDGLLGKIKSVVDSIYIIATCFQDHVRNLQNVLGKLSSVAVCSALNPPKCTFTSQSPQVLGFRVDKNGRYPTEDKVKAIAATTAPKDVQQLQ
ncbi:hypothetical protein FOCC_FOCC016912 [Frankliniella occidentalis]|nr:hypothetical protein FOCC_FOCC016912 [Frankliniella occidentalis]